MSALATTWSNRHFPNAAGWLRDLSLIIMGSLFVASLAQVAIPLQPVPITGQTFAVLLVGAAYGSKRGAACLGLYLAEGAFGLPFFAGGAHGLNVVMGPTGGYLFGFIAAAFVIGLLAEHGLDRNLSTSFIPFLIGTAIIYIFGVIWLAVVLGSFGQAVTFGLAPFLIGDAIKLIAAGFALPAAWRLVR